MGTGATQSSRMTGGAPGVTAFGACCERGGGGGGNARYQVDPLDGQSQAFAWVVHAPCLVWPRHHRFGLMLLVRLAPDASARAHGDGWDGTHGWCGYMSVLDTAGGFAKHADQKGWIRVMIGSILAFVILMDSADSCYGLEIQAGSTHIRMLASLLRWSPRCG